MCGICGFWNLDGRKAGSRDLLAMTRTLRHRGPDDEGQLLWDGRQADARVGYLGLGHTRLSIQDLSPLGHQPMTDEAGEIWVVFNGEVYNFQEIAEELRGQGHRFRSRADTEVILAAYRQWGLDCVQRFNGMFAIALWDRRVEKLHLIRDRLGVKPLYYYRKNGSFAFASELKALLAYPFFEKELDSQAMVEYLIFQYVPYPRAIFKNTWKLAPGHTLTVSADGGVEDRVYWSANGAFETRVGAKEKSESELLEELEPLLLRSVRYRMISDVPLGAFLSGGIDSSLVVALMQKLSSKPVRTFSIGFADPEFDEAPYAKAVARHLGTEHRELYVGPREVRETLPRLPEFYDEPFADTSAIPTMLLSALARSEVTVSLSGDGGDELFGGYTRYQTMVRAQRFLRIPAGLRASGKILRRIPSCFLQGHSFWLREHESTEDVYTDLMSTWDRESLRRLLGASEIDLSETVFHESFAAAKDRGAPEQAAFADLKTYLPECILTKLDRASMSVSLEAREPLLDCNLVAFALSLPFHWKIRNGSQKYILKRLLGRYLPQTLYERPKCGFNMPVSKWLRNDLRDLAETYLDGSRLNQQGLFDPVVVRRVLQKHLSGTDEHYPKLYALMNFQFWYENFFRTAAPVAKVCAYACDA
jgi:asparagine synthase (glutamine-hydrolysing)